MEQSLSHCSYGREAHQTCQDYQEGCWREEGREGGRKEVTNDPHTDVHACQILQPDTNEFLAQSTGSYADYQGLLLATGVFIWLSLDLCETQSS